MISALGDDLMYQLSTAGQELFHSNILYWLATEAAEESAAVWAVFGLEVPTEAFREYQKVDLRVDSGDRHLFLENKVMALPDASQLGRYSGKLEEQGFGDTSQWILLTLIPPTFNTAQVGTGRWKCVTYADLLPALREARDAMPERDRNLVSRYTDMVEHLVDLAAMCDPARDMESPFWMDAPLQDTLDRARLASLVKKLQMARCTQRVRDALLDVGPRPDGARVEAGLSTRSKGGIVQHFIEYKFGRVTRQIGWQLEGRQLRLVGILGDKEWKRIDPDQRGQVLAEENEGYFSFDHEFEEFSDLLEPYLGKRDWLQYGEQFRYRYSTVSEHTTWSQLVDLLVHASERAYRQASLLGR
ncbi:PD-(D/E)XK nuclease family protein [Dietzia sp. CQ4]|uniref:PD-(D/E)XK nuclease family protein n=1 Tax=Dietzia sp. (strain CQ4) TaxID=370437 RepID=UPI0015FD0506